MEYLMAMQVADNFQQLTKELVGVFAVLEIVGMVGNTLCKCLAIDILHQNAIVGKRDISDKIGMLQTIARLKLLAEGFLIADVAGKLLFQPFQEM